MSGGPPKRFASNDLQRHAQLWGAATQRARKACACRSLTLGKPQEREDHAKNAPR